MLFRQSNPTLNPEQAFTTVSRTSGCPLGMRNSTAGRHEIHCPGRNLERIPLTVAMHNSSVKQIGNRRETDVGVGPHVEAMSRKELGWSHLIEEDEGSNHLALVAGQSTTDFEAIAQIAYARHDDKLKRVARSPIPEYWINGGQPTHHELQFFLPLNHR